MVETCQKAECLAVAYDLVSSRVGGVSNHLLRQALYIIFKMLGGDKCYLRNSLCKLVWEFIPVIPATESLRQRISMS